MTDSMALQPIVRKKSFNTLANQITILRLLMIPVIVIALLNQSKGWVIGLLSFTMFTDFLDGLAARLRGERTQLGRFLDPMADKLLLTSLFLVLTVLGRLDIWVFVVIFSRDLLIVLGWVVIYILTGSSNIHPRILGKITTAIQMTTALVLILSLSPGVHKFFIWLSVAVTVASAIDYVIVGEKKLGEWN